MKRLAAAAALACSLFGLTGCDQPNSSQAQSADAGVTPETIWVDVSATAGGQSKSVEFDEVLDREALNEARAQVSAARYDCASVQRLWLIKFTQAADAKILKVSCAGANEFQLTLFDGKGFVKPWSGVLLGT